MNFRSQQISKLRGSLLENEPLAKHTSWRVGGPAKYLYRPADIDDLSLFLSCISEEEPIIFLGAGTNILVRDTGFDGTVILLCDTLDIIKSEDRGQRTEDGGLKSSYCIYVEAGALSAKLSHFAATQGLTGLEFLAGIPGTVGGALAMNAGAYGSQIWDYVVEVEVINRNGQRFVLKPNDFEIGCRRISPKFRDQRLKKWTRSDSSSLEVGLWPLISEFWFTAAHFSLQKEDKNVILQTIRELLKKRKISQPLDLPSAGSTFRNPKNNYAARLIEDCGLKGYRIGGACVSEKHANFIVNDKGASAADIEKLIAHVREVVKKKTGVKLELEVKVIG